MSVNLAGKIKELRAERDWTQEDLAKKSGVTRTYIATIETEKVRRPAAEYFLKLARAFNVRPEVLYEAAGLPCAKVRYERKETAEEILDRLKLATPISIPVYMDFPFHAGAFTEPIEYVYRERPQGTGKNIEGYLVHGECLEPVIKDNDIIIIDRDAEIKVGKIVACCFEGKMVLGRLMMIGKEIRVENSNLGVKFADCEMCALVIEVIRRLV